MNTVPKVEAMPDATSWITRWVRRYLKLSVTPFVAILVFPSPGKPIAILTFRDICLQIPGDGSAQRQLQTTFDDVCKAVPSMTANLGISWRSHSTAAGLCIIRKPLQCALHSHGYHDAPTSFSFGCFRHWELGFLWRWPRGGRGLQSLGTKRRPLEDPSDSLRPLDASGAPQRALRRHDCQGIRSDHL